MTGETRYCTSLDISPEVVACPVRHKEVVVVQGESVCDLTILEDTRGSRLNSGGKCVRAVLRPSGGRAQ